MAHLSKRDWQRQLKLRENARVKKTGISDALASYEKATKKNDNSARVSALELLQTKIAEAKRKWSDNKTLGTYLDQMKKEAKTEEDRITSALADTDDSDLDGSGSDLAKALDDVKKKASEDKPYQFVVTPGKPSTGVIIHKRKITAKHIKSAQKIRGKGGPYFVGSCHFDSGKYRFNFVDQPPKGLARAIKLAARLHAEMAIKVVVSGGGLEYDDDDDDALEEAGETRVTRGGASNYPDAASFDPIVLKIATLPADKRDAAASGTMGKINELRKQAQDDPDLSASERAAILAALDAATKNVAAAVKGVAVAAPSEPEKYPSEAYWQEQLDLCFRLASDKRNAAIEALRGQIAETGKALRADEDLSAMDKKAELEKLNAVFQSMSERTREYVSALKSASKLDLSDRLRALESEFDIARKQTVLPDEIQSDVAKAILSARKVLAAGDATASGEALDTLEAKVKAANKVAFGANAKVDRDAKQARVYDSVRQGIAIFKKGAFASGTADALFAEKKGQKLDKGLKKLGDLFRACEKDPSAANLTKLSTEGRAYLQTISKAKGKLDPDKDTGKIAALEAAGKRAKKAVQRVALLELANEMDALGAPPWSDSDGEKMAELQVAFFFEEGAIKLGEAEFGAPQLGGPEDNAGVNEAWWIKRVDADADRPADPDSPDAGAKKSATKTYIFKPQDLEATNLVGIPDKGGSVREVLASRLNDQMISFGFDIGVCPTHMVRIDSTKLEGLADTDAPKTFGAVQELGENSGSVGSEIRKDPDALAAALDHKNISDIAVFDMMFLSLDRHADNLLLQDEGDGKKRLLPIDHGIGLPDPIGLGMFRNRMTGAQNILMDEVMKPDALLDEETRTNLKKMDAGKLIADARKAQTEAEQRHPEMAGKFDHAEFDRMFARIEFMKAAADTLTSREMAQAISTFSSRINATAPKDMPALVKELAAQIKKANAGAEKVAVLTSGGGDHPYGELQALGWGTRMSKVQVDIWAQENGDLVARILKGKMPNPDAAKEVADLLKQLDPETLEPDWKSKPIGTQLEYLQSEIDRAADGNAFKKRQSEIGDMGGTQAALAALNKNGALDTVRRLFPNARLDTPEDQVDALMDMKAFEALGGEAEFNLLMSFFPDQRPDQPASAARDLADWIEINKMGGLRVYVDLGGVGEVDTRPGTVLRMFKDLKRLENSAAADKINAMDPAAIDAGQKKRVLAEMDTLRDVLKGVLVPKAAADFAKDVSEATDLIKAEDWDAAQVKLTTTLSRARIDAEFEANNERKATERLTTIIKQLRSAKTEKAETDFSAIEADVKAAAAVIKAHDYMGGLKALQKLELDLDRALNGDASEAAKLDKAIADMDARVSAIKASTEVDSKDLERIWGETKGYAEYNLGRFGSERDKFEAKIAYAEWFVGVLPKLTAHQCSPDERAEIDKGIASVKRDLSHGGTANFDFYSKKFADLLGEDVAA